MEYDIRYSEAWSDDIRYSNVRSKDIQNEMFGRIRARIPKFGR